ncbi:hypothetical protein Cadr_000017584 [Camelus dromedarius]|uniref:Uncharacterized protein n=1 Tax=Camelus dromedarius TaxID=9838 RepID=A0A5N4DE42_CAMDR|nr:hypothetical protein Cadr_000017584 [Camelus dromedarius]
MHISGFSLVLTTPATLAFLDPRLHPRHSGCLPGSAWAPFPVLCPGSSQGRELATLWTKCQSSPDYESSPRLPKDSKFRGTPDLDRGKPARNSLLVRMLRAFVFADNKWCSPRDPRTASSGSTWGSESSFPLSEIQPTRWGQNKITARRAAHCSSGSIELSLDRHHPGSQEPLCFGHVPLLILSEPHSHQLVLVPGSGALPHQDQTRHGRATLPSESGVKGDANHILPLGRVPACDVRCWTRQSGQGGPTSAGSLGSILAKLRTPGSRTSGSANKCTRRHVCAGTCAQARAGDSQRSESKPETVAAESPQPASGARVRTTCSGPGASLGAERTCPHTFLLGLLALSKGQRAFLVLRFWAQGLERCKLRQTQSREGAGLCGEEAEKLGRQLEEECLGKGNVRCKGTEAGESLAGLRSIAEPVELQESFRKGSQRREALPTLVLAQAVTTPLENNDGSWWLRLEGGENCRFLRLGIWGQEVRAAVGACIWETPARPLTGCSAPGPAAWAGRVWGLSGRPGFLGWERKSQQGRWPEGGEGGAGLGTPAASEEEREAHHGGGLLVRDGKGAGGGSGAETLRRQGHGGAWATREGKLLPRRGQEAGLAGLGLCEQRTPSGRGAGVRAKGSRRRGCGSAAAVLGELGPRGGGGRRGLRGPGGPGPRWAGTRPRRPADGKGRAEPLEPLSVPHAAGRAGPRRCAGVTTWRSVSAAAEQGLAPGWGWGGRAGGAELRGGGGVGGGGWCGAVVRRPGGCSLPAPSPPRSHRLSPPALLAARKLALSGIPPPAGVGFYSESSRFSPFRAALCMLSDGASQQPREVRTAITSVLQGRKLKPREVKQLAQGHTARKERAEVQIKEDLLPELGFQSPHSAVGMHMLPVTETGSLSPLPPTCLFPSWPWHHRCKTGTWSVCAGQPVTTADRGRGSHPGPADGTCSQEERPALLAHTGLPRPLDLPLLPQATTAALELEMQGFHQEGAALTPFQAKPPDKWEESHGWPGTTVSRPRPRHVSGSPTTPALPLGGGWSPPWSNSQWGPAPWQRARSECARASWEKGEGRGAGTPGKKQKKTEGEAGGGGGKQLEGQSAPERERASAAWLLSVESLGDSGTAHPDTGVVKPESLSRLCNCLPAHDIIGSSTSENTQPLAQMVFLAGASTVMPSHRPCVVDVCKVPTGAKAENTERGRLQPRVGGCGGRVAVSHMSPSWHKDGDHPWGFYSVPPSFQDDPLPFCPDVKPCASAKMCPGSICTASCLQASAGGELGLASESREADYGGPTHEPGALHALNQSKESVTTAQGLLSFLPFPDLSKNMGPANTWDVRGGLWPFPCLPYRFSPLFPGMCPVGWGQVVHSGEGKARHQPDLGRKMNQDNKSRGKRGGEAGSGKARELGRSRRAQVWARAPRETAQAKKMKIGKKPLFQDEFVGYMFGSSPFTWGRTNQVKTERQLQAELLACVTPRGDTENPVRRGFFWDTQQGIAGCLTPRFLPSKCEGTSLSGCQRLRLPRRVLPAEDVGGIRCVFVCARACACGGEAGKMRVWRGRQSLAQTALNVILGSKPPSGGGEGRGRLAPGREHFGCQGRRA